VTSVSGLPEVVKNLKALAEVENDGG
jgi:hypothetical protein